MAKVKNNAITSGLSGKYGGQLVFRQVAGKTFVVKKPGPRSKPASAAQLANEERFRRGIAYARSAMADASMKSIYEAGRGKRLPFRVALSDFCNAPRIDAIDANGYTGLPNEKILITAVDDFKIVAVTVAIYNAYGMVEEGAAVPAADGLRWIYTTGRGNRGVPGSKLVVTAKDYPGNITSQELIFP